MQRDDEVRLTLPLTPSARRLAAAVAADLGRQLGAGAEVPIKVGLIGFVPPQIMLWDRGHLEGQFATRDIVEAATAWVPQLREEGADIVIALSHSGIDPAAYDKRGVLEIIRAELLARTRYVLGEDAIKDLLITEFRFK